MKKKKLKKRIKKLENVIAQTAESHRTMISNLGEKYTELREDFNRFNQRYNTDLEVLKKRADIDYTQFSKPIVDTSKGPDTVFVTGETIENSPTPSCETCKYKGFGVLGADSPCFGCVVTEGNFKMYEPNTL